jgi:hypothetical protein
MKPMWEIRKGARLRAQGSRQKNTTESHGKSLKNIKPDMIVSSQGHEDFGRKLFTSFVCVIQ